MNIIIKRLRLVDCGPIRDTRIDFVDNHSSGPVTVIGGANGSGKTTVLEVISALLRTIETPVIRNSLLSALAAANPTVLPSPSTHQRVVPFDPRQSVLAGAGFAQLDVNVDGHVITFAYGKRPTDYMLPEGTEEFHLSPDKTFLQQTYGPVTMDLIRDVQFATSQPVELGFPPQMPSGLPTVLFFPHSRIIHHTSADQILKEPTPYRWVHEYTAVTSFEGSLDSAFIWLDYSDSNAFAWLKELADGLDLDGKTFSVDRKGLRVMVTTRDGKQHPLALLSSGEQNILIFAIELARRLLPGSIVLIDEIENSLHPAFQAKLGQILLEMQKKIPFQLIVTTHAPAFVDVFGADRTVILTEL